MSGYERRKCSVCGEGLGFSESDPCDKHDEPKMIAITDFLTPAELVQARQMMKPHLTGTYTKSYAQRVREVIIEPNIERINKALGQENDAMYLAFVVEYVMTKTS